MKIAITGSSGYLASCLIPLLETEPSIDGIVGIDIAEPPKRYSKFVFRKMDILDTKQLEQVFSSVTCVVHMAFHINGMHDKKLLERLNVGGSRSVMRAIAGSGKVKKLVFLSSTAAYGVHKDNPVPMKEDSPLRGKGTFFYADQKHRLEEELVEFEKKYPEISVVRLRLCTTTGPRAYNSTVDLYTAPVFVAFPFHQPPVQLLHEDDAARGIHLAIMKNVRGAFNLGSDWDFTAKRHAKLAGTKIIVLLPVWLSKAVAYVSWWLRLVQFDPAWIQAALYPAVADISKAKEVLGWEPKFSSDQSATSLRKKR
jgi:UDP-glucose 4-epimerase